MRKIASDIVASHDSDEYIVFRKIISVLPALPPNKFHSTWRYFLGLLADIYETTAARPFSTLVRRDMVTPLLEASRKSDRRNLNQLDEVIEKVMEFPSSEHDIQRTILSVVGTDECPRELRQRIFDSAKKRAFRYPRDFGYDLLKAVKDLGHRAFWLDVHSLRDIWIHSGVSDDSIVQCNADMFAELCSKVFCGLEDPRHAGVRRGRVFARLMGQPGIARIQCTDPDGQACQCEGKSLSLKGLFSQRCRRRPGERMRMRLTVDGIAAPLTVEATVADVHTDENGVPVSGRGIVLADADDGTAKAVYEYVSSRTPAI